MAQGLTLALLGASSLAAENLLRLLEDSSIPVRELLALDEGAKIGKTLEFKGHHLAISPVSEASFAAVDIALATVPLSGELQQSIQEAGATLVAPAACLADADNHRLMLADHTLERESLQRGMVVALPAALDTLLARLLAPVEEEFGIKTLSVAWTRSVSHDGQRAIEALAAETAALLNGRKAKSSFYKQGIAFNLLPQDTEALEAGFLQLWHDLWGRHQLRYALQSQIAPVFFGDVVNFFLELETNPQPNEFESLFKAQPNVESNIELIAKANALQSSSEPGQRDALIRLAKPRRLDGPQPGYACTLMADIQMAGLADNQIRCMEHLAKNLFFS